MPLKVGGTGIAAAKVGATGIAKAYVGSTLVADFAAAPAPSAYASAVLADSPYAYYRLNDSSGSPADSSGNSRHATAVAGTPVYNTTGGPVSDGGYLTFDGSTEYVTLGNLDDFIDGQNQGAIELWSRKSATTRGCYVGQLNSGDSTSIQLLNNSNDAFSVTQTDGFAGYFRESDGSARSWRAGGYTEADDGAWHHVVFTWDYTGTDTETLYIDGSAASFSVTNFTSMTGSMTSFDASLTMGARNNRGTVGGYLNGDLAEVAFYRTALSSTRIAAHYAAA
jgi:hypothetical protein